MTPKERAAIQQALEALENAPIEYDFHGNPMDVEFGQQLNEAITALREALAEPELNLNCKSVQARLATSWGYVKAEQAEQEPVGWTHALQLAESALLSYEDITTKQWDEAIASIRAVKDSLTAEPLRFGCLYPGGRLEVFKTRKRAQEYVDGSLRNGADVKLIELYASPVRTKDLTDDELQPFLDEWWNLPCDTAHDVKKIFRAVIAADREKNK